jgi:hypothetical protein
LLCSTNQEQLCCSSELRVRILKPMSAMASLRGADQEKDDAELASWSWQQQGSTIRMGPGDG